jgi:hypothetical protein
VDVHADIQDQLAKVRISATAGLEPGLPQTMRKAD